MTSKKNVSSRELFRHTFKIMELLEGGKIGVEEAKAQANLIKQSNNILRYELDRAKAIEKYDGIKIRDIED